MCLRAADHGKVLHPIAGSRRLRTSRLLVSATAVASHCEIELLNLVCHRAPSFKTHSCFHRFLEQALQDTRPFCAIPLVAPLLTSLWPARQHSCTTRDSSRPYSSPSHRCIRGLKPHHSSFSCASSGRGPGSAVGTNHAPLGDRQVPATDLFCPELRVCRLLRERAGLRPRVPTTLLRETPAVDEGPFLSRTQGSSAHPDGG